MFLIFFGHLHWLLSGKAVWQTSHTQGRCSIGAATGPPSKAQSSGHEGVLLRKRRRTGEPAMRGLGVSHNLWIQKYLSPGYCGVQTGVCVFTLIGTGVCVLTLIQGGVYVFTLIQPGPCVFTLI